MVWIDIILLIIIIVLYFGDNIIQGYFPAINHKINEIIFSNKSLPISIFIFMFFLVMAYASFRDIFSSNEHKIYHSIRFLGILAGALYTAYTVYKNIENIGHP